MSDMGDGQGRHMGYEVIRDRGDRWHGVYDGRQTVQWFETFHEARDAFREFIPEPPTPDRAVEVLRRSAEWGEKGWRLTLVEMRERDGRVLTETVARTSEEAQAVRVLEDLVHPLCRRGDGED